MNEIVVYPSKEKMIPLAAGALIFFGLVLGMAISEDEAGLLFWERVICYWVGIPLFGYIFLYLCYRLIVTKPAVIVNHEGIFDNASAFSAGLVNWAEITDIHVHEYRGQRYLCIVPLDMNAFLQRQPVFKRLLLNASAFMGFPPINIPQATLWEDVDELALEIQKYRRERVGQRGRT